ncbi:MAG: DUF4097 domain-containing protein [Ruminococcaceae bacterium]|nr:DUF4097 domain-containing protein [Oscillospiraceae bacterium]
MARRTKIWLTAAASMLLLGCLIFGGVMMALDWDFTKLSTVHYETNTYEIREVYENISIHTQTSDVEIIPSADGKTTVICKEETKRKHLVSVENGTLTIRLADTTKWYERMGIHFGKTKITVAVPEKAYNTIETKLTTGDISAKNLTAQQMELNLTTGDMKLSHISCKNLNVKATTGDIVLQNVIAQELLKAKGTTGDIKLHQCDAGELEIETTTGDITGFLLSPKQFTAKTTTGSVNVPQSEAGGPCSLKATTGDIRITLDQIDEK